MLDDRIKQRLGEAYEKMQHAGDLLPLGRLDECYSLFRNRFGPDALRQLDGERLLDTMHTHGRDTLVYWLEFKNDEEFPGEFGSIAGGSALKFGLYRRKETGSWMTGSSQKQQEVSVSDAIDIARRHRDQLIAGSEIISNLSQQAGDEEYLSLQREMDRWAPDIGNSAWGHKYFSLLFPDKLDDYHREDFQRFHLVKLLQRPPNGAGRYLAAGMYVRLGRELGLPLNHLTSVLNQVNGRPYRIWRIGASLGEAQSDTIWPMMRDHDCVAIGWPQVGDMSRLEHNQESKTWIAGLLRRQYNLSPGVATRKAGEMLNFAFRMTEGEPVLAASGERILGLGRIAGAYRFDQQVHDGAPHQRSVEWKPTGEFELPVREGLRTTVFALRKSFDNLIDVERRLLDAPSSSVRGTRRFGRPAQLDGISGRVQSILERKGQVILYGPPGTGKTFCARQAALDLAALGAFGQRFEKLDASGRTRVEGGESQRGLFRMCTFHPAYGYEDFIEGYRPAKGQDGALVFGLTDGIFKQICSDAEREPKLQFYLLIDEINRGDIPRIFGELLTLLERDKRGKEVYLPVSGRRFSVPENVHIIGTMNTADRSIALLDTALRRRFGFVELMPKPALLEDVVLANSIPLSGWLAALNDRIREHIGRDARNLQVGHSYLMKGGKPIGDFGEFVRVLAEDIIPLLEEYCYEDYSALAKILGPGLVDDSGQRIRNELLERGRHDELVQAVMEPSPELGTSQEMVAQTQEEDEAPDEDDQDAGDGE